MIEEIIGPNSRKYEISNTTYRFDPDHDSYYIDYENYEIKCGIPYKLFRESKKKTNLYFKDEIDAKLRNKIIFYFSQSQELRNGNPPRFVFIHYYCKVRDKLICISYNEEKTDFGEDISDREFVKPKSMKFEYLKIIQMLKNKHKTKIFENILKDKSITSFIILAQMPKIVLSCIFQFIDY